MSTNAKKESEGNYPDVIGIYRRPIPKTFGIGAVISKNTIYAKIKSNKD